MLTVVLQYLLWLCVWRLCDEWRPGTADQKTDTLLTIYGRFTYRHATGHITQVAKFMDSAMWPNVLANNFGPALWRSVCEWRSAPGFLAAEQRTDTSDGVGTMNRTEWM